MYHAADLRGVGCQTGYACVHKLTNSAGLFSGLLCLLLSRLHSLQRSFDGNQAFAQNADSIEKTIEAVFVNRGWFSHNACHHINPEEGKLARCNTRGWIRRQWSGRSCGGISPWRDHVYLTAGCQKP